MTLTAPVAAYSESGSTDHAQCGPLAAQAVVAALGVHVPVPSPGDDNENAGTMAGWINSLGNGLHALVVDMSVTPMSIIPPAVTAGQYVMVGVNCNGSAEPVNYVTGTRHWLAAYSVAGDVLNVWLPSYERPDLDACHSSLMDSVVVWRDGPVPPTPAPPGPAALGDGMGACFALPDGTQQARFWVTAAGDIEEVWYTQADAKWHGPVDASVSWWGDKGSVAGGLSACFAPNHLGLADGAQLVFWTGKDGHQYEAWFAANKWNGPIAITGT